MERGRFGERPRSIPERNIMKLYTVRVNGTDRTFQFREGEQPAGAEEVKTKQAPKPANKARKPKAKD